MVLLNEIMSNGEFIDEGKNRKVYKYNSSVYKIGECCKFSNKREYELSNSVNGKFYNPTISITEDGSILEVEECIPLDKFVMELNSIDISKKQSLRVKMSCLDIFDIIKSYKLWDYMKFTKDDILELYRKSRHDYDEIMYPLNWGLNIKSNSLVILDYAD